MDLNRNRRSQQRHQDIRIRHLQDSLRTGRYFSLCYYNYLYYLYVILFMLLWFSSMWLKAFISLQIYFERIHTCCRESRRAWIFVVDSWQRFTYVQYWDNRMIKNYNITNFKNKLNIYFFQIYAFRRSSSHSYNILATDTLQLTRFRGNS